MMKQYKTQILVIAGLALLISACQKNYEKEPIERVNLDRVFDSRDSLGENAARFLNSVYSYLKSGHNRVDGRDYLDVASDDAVSSNATTNNVITRLSNGNYNAGTFPITDANDGLPKREYENSWAWYYTAIRNANIFITNIDVVPVQRTLPNLPTVSVKYAWKNEARFLRAFYYFELVKRYGGVPLVGDQVFDSKSDLKIPRNTFEDCINYIVSECTAIKDTLYANPLVNPNSDYGRVTQGAALALRAQVLLYAASPLYNGGNIEPGNALTGYAGTTADAQKWVQARDAAKEVYDKFSLVPNFRDVFLTQNNSEVIFIRVLNNGTDVENNNAPPGFASRNAYTSPTQDLVDAFPMLDGKPIGTSGKYNYSDQNPYANRDPRMDATVFRQGTPWLGNTIRVYEGATSKPNNGQTQTLTGYYMKKFMGYSENTTQYQNHNEDWVIFRTAGMALNYAEAENEVSGPTNAVYAVLRRLRQRAGIEEGDGNYGLATTTDKNVMRKMIQNERRIEMAFEEQRFFDIRRWKIADEVMKAPRRGVTIVQATTGLTYTYGPVLPGLINNPSLDPKKRYFYPIPQDEVLKNPNMVQNPGW